MDPIAKLISNEDLEEEEEIGYNELSNDCDNPKKFLIDFEIAKRERLLRDQRKADLINSLAIEELKWKLNGKPLPDFIKKNILKTKTDLARLLELEELDERLKPDLPAYAMKEYHKPMVYEYFKVITVKNSPESRDDRVFDIEDGDGILFEFDFFVIADGRINRDFRNTSFYRKVLKVYRDASYYGAIIAVGKMQNSLVIKDVYALEKIPQHLLYDQRIDPLNDDVPVVTASAVSVARAHAIVDQDI